MEIKVYGSGCSKCRATERAVLTVVQEMGLDVNVEKVSDIKKIMEAGIMSTPALSVDGKIVCIGRVPDKTEIKDWMSCGSCNGK